MDLFSAPNDRELPFKIPSEDGYSYSWCEAKNGFDIKIPYGHLFYADDLINKAISDRSLEYFLENNKLDWTSTNWRVLSTDEFSKIIFKNLIWRQDYIEMYGKTIALPRLTSWYADNGKSYTYSGILSEPNEWNKGLNYIKKKVESLINIDFNSVLLNWYRDGEDHQGWHADDETELGKKPTIASVSFGATRDFILRNNSDHQKIYIPLKHGSLLVMSGDIQRHWQHSLPKRKRVKSSRVNLTFRKIID